MARLHIAFVDKHVTPRGSLLWKESWMANYVFFIVILQTLTLVSWWLVNGSGILLLNFLQGLTHIGKHRFN